jgi:prepilin-type N-terminal cleavage/methylation domain-containing protein
MSMTSPPPRSLARDEAGFTLIELLVAITCGLIVTGALFAILEVSLQQTARITDRVQATQIGRATMTKMVDELHSACLAREFAPIQAKSGGKELRFIAGFSEKSVIEYPEVSEHRISWTGTYPGGGQLLDKTFKANGGTWPNKFTWESTATPASGVILAENIYQQSSTVPIFQYYKYATTATTGGAETSSGALALETPPAEGFSATTAKGLAGVRVNFSAAPTDNNTAAGRTSQFNSLVTLAFAAPAAEATIVDGPCQ